MKVTWQWQNLRRKFNAISTSRLGKRLTVLQASRQRTLAISAIARRVVLHFPAAADSVFILVQEVSHAGEDHSHAEAVGSGDDLMVAN